MFFFSQVLPYTVFLLRFPSDFSSKRCFPPLVGAEVASAVGPTKVQGGYLDGRGVVFSVSV